MAIFQLCVWNKNKAIFSPWLHVGFDFEVFEENIFINIPFEKPQMFI